MRATLDRQRTLFVVDECQLAKVISRSELTNDTVDRLILTADYLRPALDVTLFNDVEKITDFTGAYDNLSLVVPISLEAVE